ncbi:MAG: OB-fold nucleic acid binding domain-containing protein [Desulfurococcales archaeon]|nr:OB-fold nucleic acid binding domain-containing protein [Desulfurococcales archaeon]
MSEEQERKVLDLKEGEDNVKVRVRVLETSDPKVIQTRKGPKTISEAIVGDETGRIKLTLWGKHAGTLKKGDAVEISGAWTTQYRGKVQINVGYKGEIKQVEDESVPGESDVPESMPEAENPFQYRRRNYRSQGYGYSGRSYK